MCVTSYAGLSGFFDAYINQLLRCITASSKQSAAELSIPISLNTSPISASTLSRSIICKCGSVTISGIMI